MQYSAEARWFFSGGLPAGVRQWFGVADEHATPPESDRGDQYLVLPHCDTVGVKLRQGRFEVKAQTAAPRPLVLPEVGSVRVDQWIKWSVKDKIFEQLGPVFQQDQDCRWRTVGKKRWLRKFAAAAGAVSEVLPASTLVPVGCNVELTEVEVDAQPGQWFTIGFEAFGEPGSVAQTLAQTLAHVFRTRGAVPGVALSGLNAQSYPVWLAALAWRD